MISSSSSSLKHSHSEVSQLAFISRLSLLQSLVLYKCHRLKELPELPPSLTELNVNSNVLNKVPDLSNLHRLTDLRIGSAGAKLDWNGSFPSNCKLQTLILDVLNISRLPGLTCCSELTHLELKCQYSFKVLPNISGLMKLVNLKIESCHMLKEIPGIQKLQCLTSLHINDCPSLKSLENLRELQALRELELISCGKLTEIPGIGELRCLTQVKVEHCQSLERIEDLTELKELKKVRLMDCPWLTEIPGLGKGQVLTQLILEDCNSLETLDCLTSLKRLQELTLKRCLQLTEIPGLGGLLCLTSLQLWFCYSLLRLENLRELQQLKCFKLLGCQKLMEIPGLDKLRCSTILVMHEDGDSLVIFESKTESLNSNIVEVGKLREDVCREHQSSLKRSSVLVFGSNEHVASSDGSRSFPISELEGKLVSMCFSPSWSISSIEFTLELLDAYEKLKATSSDTAFEIVYVQRDDDHRLFWRSFGSLPWLSLHPSSLDRYKELYAYFKVPKLSTEPTLVIVGEDGKVVNFNAVDMIKEHGANAYPFTLERLEQIVNSNENNEELFMDTNMIWPKKLQHHLHIHQLVPTLRRIYKCNCCNQEGELWSYCCEECDFDLHCQCASLKDMYTTDQFSSLEEEVGDLQFLENLTRDPEGNNEDLQGQLLDLPISQDAEHVNLHTEQSCVCSGSPDSRSCLAWSCCLPFLFFFRS